MALIGKALALLAATPLLLSVLPLRQLFGSFDPGSVRGKRVLVCGASTGIGEQLVYQYARLGAHVALVARRPEQLERVATEARRLGAASASSITADFSTDEGTISALDQVLQLAPFDGELDVLVLNHVLSAWGWLLPDNVSSAADRLGRPQQQWSSAATEKLFRVNALSYFTLATTAMPSLIRAARTAQGASSIVVVSSGAGKFGPPKTAPYSASKHALHGFFDSMRLELAYKRLPVTVTTCVLGKIETENAMAIAGEVMQKFPPPASAEDTAAAVLRAGAAGLREMVYPLSQGIHLLLLVRPWPGMADLIDQILMFAT